MSSVPLDRNTLARDLARLLTERPGQDKRQLLRALESLGWSGLTTTDVNSVLYETRRPFIVDSSTPPTWRVDVQGLSAAVLIAEPELGLQLEDYAGVDPRSWQEEALAAWLAAGRRGVVEAVTGTGKTTVGIIAAADAFSRGVSVMVVVPGRDLLDQWYGQMVRDLPSARVGRYGDGHKDSLHECDVVVATVQSACREWMLPDGQEGLLIADEVHHYGADKYALALEANFEERLGLTATYERSDNGIGIHLSPYFSPLSEDGGSGAEVVAGCDYERGLADGILARFRVGLLPVAFSPGEAEEYERLDSSAGRARALLIQQFGCPSEPFGEFMRGVTLLSEGGHEKATQVARRYLGAFTKRRALLADCGRKLEALAALGPLFSRADRALVFTETVESARRAAKTVTQHGTPAVPYTSRLTREERARVLADFRSGRTRVVAAPRVLDEGVDVPEADLGVILAASHSRRQMIQRMGRVIRPKEDGRPASFIITYVKGTSEDPENGAHGAFLEEMMGVAEQVEAFSTRSSTRELLDWYLGE